MKQLRIELNEAWVFLHRNDTFPPVAIIRGELTKLVSVEIKASGACYFTLVFDEDKVGIEEIKNVITKTLTSKYTDVVIDKVLTIEQIETADNKDNENKDEVAKDSSDQDINNILDEINKRLFDANDDDDDDFDIFDDDDDDDFISSPIARRFNELKKNQKEEREENALDLINDLVGAKEFKALASEIDCVAKEIQRTKTFDVFANICYLFAINDGDGLSTYLELFAKLISQKGLCSLVPDPVEEKELDEYKESDEPFHSALRAVTISRRSNMDIVCIDISTWMDKTDNRHFRDFLRVIEKYAENHIVIFRVPFVEKDILRRIQVSLSDLLTVKTITFPPLNNDEIKTFAKKELKRYDYSITDNAWDYFSQRITEEKSDGRFYGFNTIKKIIRELIYQKHIKNAKSKEKSSLFDENDTMELCQNKDSVNLSGEELLNRLVGVDGIKERIHEIIAQIEISMQSSTEDRPCIHMRFIGNPGTGKTTIARIIGKMLSERGVLRVGAFFERSGRDFCGRYIGETAPKTQSICRDAYGSVLFIDEAYSLYRGDNDSKDFGREALDTLIAEMENHRNDLVVIMAGYTDDIDTLMKGNAGLASRMPYIIEFPNFSRKQLFDIFVSMVKSKCEYEENLFDSAREFFDSLPDTMLNSKEFANARYVRNLFERVCGKASMRAQLNGQTKYVLQRDDFLRATLDKEFALDSKKGIIGF